MLSGDDREDQRDDVDHHRAECVDAAEDEERSDEQCADGLHVGSFLLVALPDGRDAHGDCDGEDQHIEPARCRVRRSQDAVAGDTSEHSLPPCPEQGCGSQSDEVPHDESLHVTSQSAVKRFSGPAKASGVLR